MKSIKEYINESLASAQPKDKKELQAIIADRIKKDGPECDLNDIDVSHMTDMSDLFANMKDFNGNISDWDVSNVENMDGMFAGCEKFNCNISHWDVHYVQGMYSMFYKCKSFKQDLSKWDVKHVKDMRYAFKNCPTQPRWYKE